MLDIHCHILSNIDDGSESIDMSIEMLKLAKEFGTKTIVATPHYCRGYFENSYEYVCEKIRVLSEKAEEIGIDINLIPGQEIFIDRYTIKDLKRGLISGFNSSKYMLVEIDMEEFKDIYLDAIYELRVQGYRPIIAHPERYKYIMDKHSLLNNFIKEGCLFQINAGSIHNLYGKKVQQTALFMVERKLCSFIASDAHRPSKRCLNLKEIIMNNSSMADLKDIILNNHEQVLIDGEIEQEYELIKEKKTFFNILKR